ncbi:MAG: hypothetical protein ACI9KE_005851 [Polyangiales bacterium]|jgi:hypothetical protein
MNEPVKHVADVVRVDGRESDGQSHPHAKWYFRFAQQFFGAVRGPQGFAKARGIETPRLAS